MVCSIWYSCLELEVEPSTNQEFILKIYNLSLNLIKKTFSSTRRLSKVFQSWDVKPPCIVPNCWDVLPIAGYGMLCFFTGLMMKKLADIKLEQTYQEAFHVRQM